MNERIFQELKQHANSVFDNLNVQLSDILQVRFEDVLINSVDRMERGRRTSDSDIEEAKRAISKFINAMYAYREKRTGQKDLLSFQALNESKSSICPLWPIC
jgi:antitoxin component of RelBE/YafQ-DinJ toxin-antitoxin module